MSAADLESAGENVPEDIDIHTTAGKGEDLEEFWEKQSIDPVDWERDGAV